MKKALFFPIILGASLIACNGAKVTPSEDPTNEDAIYNIIRFDRQLEFNLDLLDASVPDTSTLVLAPPYRPQDYWRHIDRDSLFIGMDIHYPEGGDTIGTVPWAEVSVVKTFWGTLEVISVDTVGGGAERIRMSKPFAMLGRINAIFEKVGFDYNSRRGWILTRLSDAIFDAAPAFAQEEWPLRIERIEIRRENGTLLAVNSGLKLLRDVPSFSPGESVTVFVRVNRPDDLVSIRYPAGEDYITGYPIRLDSLNYFKGFRLPSFIEFNHFAVDVVSGDAVADTFPYRPNGTGVVYRVR
jgi:hypothetical protein